MKTGNTECPFCELSGISIYAETELLVAFKDAHPVTPGHLLVIPKVHRESCKVFLVGCGESLLREDLSISGFNVGANCGSSAGKTFSLDGNAAYKQRGLLRRSELRCL